MDGKKQFMITLVLDQENPSGHTMNVRGQTFKGSKTQLMSHFARVMRENTPSTVQTTFKTDTLANFVKAWFGGAVEMEWDIRAQHYVFRGPKQTVNIKKKHASAARTAVTKYVKLRLLEEGINDGRWGNAKAS